ANAAPSGRRILAANIPASPVRVALSGDESQSEPRIRAADLVTKDAQRAIVVVDDEVDRAIVVEVARREPPSDFGELERGTAGRRAFLEFPIAQIVKELLPLMQRIRIALLPKRFDQMDGAVRRDDVEPAIVIVIEKNGPEAGERNARRRDADFDAAVVEIPAAAIEEQGALLARQVREKDVVGAVAVEI